MRAALAVLLLGLVAGAQLPPPQKAPAPVSKKVAFAALVGAAAGAVIGAQALDFSAVPADERRAHAWRAGLTYGAIGGVLAAAAAARGSAPEPPEPHHFFAGKWNTPLLVGIAAVQALDYSSTRYFRDRGKDEWLLTNQLVDNRAAFVTTEISAASAAVALCYLFHRSGHHRWERVAAAAYIAVGVISAVANYRYPATGHALF
ncbi:MAG: hypothetical protein ACRD1C_10960 [Terriglobales bacterium]